MRWKTLETFSCGFSTYLAVPSSLPVPRNLTQSSSLTYNRPRLGAAFLQLFDPGKIVVILAAINPSKIRLSIFRDEVVVDHASWHQWKVKNVGLGVCL